MTRRSAWLLALCVVGAGSLAFVDGTSVHPALASVSDVFWTVVFWLLVLVVLALLVWQVFPTPSR